METVSNRLTFIFFFILILGLFQTSFSQTEDLSDEILVYILPDSLELPDKTIEVTDTKKLKIKSKSLDKAFKKIELKLIKKAFPEFSNEDTVKFSSTGEKIKLPNMSRIFRLKLKKKNDLEEVIGLLSKEKGVLFAEPNFHDFHAHGYPNDAHYENGDQWGLYNYGQSGGTNDADIDAPEAWGITTGSSIRIGIIDDGVDSGHEDLTGKVNGDAGVYGGNEYWAFGHGTHVSGIAAAIGNNSVGIAGVNWSAQINSQRVENGSDIHFYNSIMDAVNAGSKILNNSWGGYSYSTTIRFAFANAYKLNIVSVASMGNDNTSSISYPAGYGQGIIAVGATDRTDTRSIWVYPTKGSNYGNHIDVVAPGTAIWSSLPYTNNYVSWNGTSMAAPHVAGIASLLKGYNTSLYNDDIEQIIRLTADDVNSSTDPGWDQFIGAGRVNAYKAFKLINSPNQVVRLGTYTGGTVASTSGAFTAHLYGVPGIPDGNYSVVRYEVVRDITFPQYMTPPSVPGLSFNLPQVWGNGTATTQSVTGIPYYNGDCAACCNGQVDIFGLPHTEVVPGTVTNTGVRLRTYVYKLRTLYYISGVCVPNTDLGYFPTSPSNVQFAATVVGVPGIQKSNHLSGVETPQVFSLEQNYPNPFNPTTTIRYTLPKESHVTLRIYNTLGQEIITLVNKTEEAGYHETTFDATSLSSGVYFYKIQAGDYQAIKKLLVLK